MLARSPANRLPLVLSVALATLALACGSEPAGTIDEETAGENDASNPVRLDGSVPSEDGGSATGNDAGAFADAGAGAPDATIVRDGGSTAQDSGSLGDSGGSSPDSGGASPDSGSPPDPDAGDPPPDVLNPGWIGGPCQSDTDCPFANGTCLLDANGYPGGMCTQACTQFCPDQSGPLNSVTFCLDDGDGDGEGACVSRCDYTLSPTGCRAGYVCLPEKRMNQSTVVRSACVPETGVPGRPEPAFDIGDACAVASDCNRNTCITDLPGGYCTQEACNVVGCPAGSRCFSLGLEGYHVCLKDCASSSSCRTSESYGCDQDNTCWYVPPPPPACDLGGAAADCIQYAPESSQSFVVVTKHLRRLAHCDGSALLGAYCVGLGSSPVLDKEREGDRRTPEGIFYIPRKIPNSQFYKAFLLSYPDAADAMRGLQQSIITQTEHNAIVAAQNARTEPPQNTGLGGLIEIHGNGAGADWTWGCIAVDNSTIDVLWPTLDIGDTIVVLH